LLFPEIFDRQMDAQFDEREGSSDGGTILLKAAVATSLSSAMSTPGVSHRTRDSQNLQSKVYT
jgi:hypothetical protein